MEDGFRVGRRLIVDARSKLNTLEYASGDSQTELQLGLEQVVAALEAQSLQAHGMVTHEPTNKREYWRLRLAQLDEEIAEVKRAHAAIMRKRHIQVREEQMRTDLLRERISATGDASIPIGSLSFEHETQSLNQSSSMVDDILRTGRSALEQLQVQRVSLKGTKTKMLDVANKIGVGKDIIRMIEKKENETALIVYGGMFILTLLLLLLFIWKKLL
ncbi:Golgi SNAP receptor complex member 2 [Porphyridium purpureum]|uniref:Golgi SNAP receptor complex member 2 n=1 Tax=Porphyridium purpureum TaxID=35688 RepID=A0A5J4YZX6_PORPP|nr:Golgi SNAP receptor complex member 2 [Porphyridium purpureum]|eukprot:POR2145..scf208_2